MVFIVAAHLIRFFFFNNFVLLAIFGCAGSLLFHADSLCCGEQGFLYVMHRLLLAVAPLLGEHRLQSAGPAVVAHELCCSLACGIFPDQGLNWCPLHYKVDS